MLPPTKALLVDRDAPYEVSVVGELIEVVPC